MKKLLLLLLAAWLPAAGEAALPAAVDGQPLPSLAPVLEEVTPSVVNIYTRTRVRVRSPLMSDPFFRRFFNIPDVPRERVSQSLGSGVIVDAEEGFVLTNNHVIQGADDIAVTLQDGRSLQGEIVGTDPDTDLAVIRIPAEGLKALPLADSGDLRVGDFVVAVGNPFGLGQTVTSGIVSALGRAGFRGLEFQNFIQTDASINPGNSGGALINLRGELVGINSAIFTPSGGNVGIGFAIPSSMAAYVMNQLIRFGEVRRGSLGVVVQNLTPELAGAFGVENRRGALVSEVLEGSAAERAGLRAGDVLTELGSYTIRNAQDFLNAEGQVPVGEPLSVDYVRDGRERTARLEIEPSLELAGETLDRRLTGAVFTELPSSQRVDGVRGVLLESLARDSRLAFEGLRPGDVITSVNRGRVDSLDDLRERLEHASRRAPLLFQLRRGGEAYIARVD
ncbi:MAG: Do family serine endopeptidase [Xanthomonadales bacterium]|jgi:serine protease DegQ|nr:Do family serine endopeptidase [Xanthomonadales bacterium]